MDLREQTMEYRKLKTINDYIRKSVNPAKLPDTLFEMYSVPIFETGHPEYLLGREIASNKTVVQKNDILLCKINPRINRVWIVADESENPNIASSEWIVVRSSKYNPEFLAWYFRSPRFKNLMTSEVTGIGGSLTRAQPKSVAEYPVPVLEKPEQDAIAIIFNTVDTIIKKRRKQLQKLDELVKARFVEMFGSPVSNPLSWRKRTLKEVCIKLNDGTHFSPESYETGQYKYITAKNIKLSGFDFSNITYVPEEVHRPIYERCNPEMGDVLYIKDGATTGIAMVNTLKEEFTLLSSVALLKQDRLVINGHFLAALLNNEDMYIDIRNNMGGAAITRLTIAKLNAIKVIVPPIEIQNKFAAFVEQVDKLKAAVQKALDEAQLLFDSLMQKYFG